MGRLLGLARTLRDGEIAATIVEYTLMILVVAIACFVSVSALGTSLVGLLQKAVVGLK